MRLGILSDTHGQADWMRYAISALRQRGATFVVHCGDIGPPALLDLFIIRPGEFRAAFVFGNSDDGRAALDQRARELGIDCLGQFGQFEMSGKKFAVLHGDDRRALRALLLAQQHDYLLHGHTHQWRDKRIGRTRIINPGPAALLRKRRPIVAPTCAILDVDAGRLEKIVLA